MGMCPYSLESELFFAVKNIETELKIDTDENGEYYLKFIERSSDGTPLERGDKFETIEKYMRDLDILTKAANSIGEDTLKEILAPLHTDSNKKIFEWVVDRKSGGYITKYGGLKKLAERIALSFKLGIDPLPHLRKEFSGLEVVYSKLTRFSKAKRGEHSRMYVWYDEWDDEVELELVPPYER